MGNRTRGSIPAKRRWRPHLLTILVVLLSVLSVGLFALVGLATNIVTGNPADLPDFPPLLQPFKDHPLIAWSSVIVLAALVETVLRLLDRMNTTVEPSTVNVTLSRSDISYGPESTRRRRDLLDQVGRVWIDGFLNRTLAEVVRVDLGLTERPDVVITAWEGLVPKPTQGTHRPGVVSAKLVDANWILHGLLILGAPGAGKTTLLLELARDLLQRAERDANSPVPVVLHLSSWPANQPSLADWLITELSRRYFVPRDYACHVVESNLLAVLLDGLDEVTGDSRRACAIAINAFRRDHSAMPLAICCRSEEFKDIGVKLELERSIEIQSLDPVMVNRWLESTGRSLAGLREVLSDPNHPLWGLLTTPLVLSIAALAYKGQPAKAIPTLSGIRQLFNTYVQTMLTRPRAALAAESERTRLKVDDMMHDLSFLALHMQDAGLTMYHPTFMPFTPISLGKPSKLPVIGCLVTAAVGLGITAALFPRLGLGASFFNLLLVATAANAWIKVASLRRTFEILDYARDRSLMQRVDYARGRGLMHRVDRGYTFIHPLLQAYFADQYESHLKRLLDQPRKR